MKKIIFTILLTIVSSVWTTSMALCYVFPNVVTTEVNTMEGTLQLDSNPCTNSEPCPPCQTLSFVADNGHSYYISFDNKYSDMLEPELDALTPYLPLRVSITGAFMSNLVDVYGINNVPFRGTGQWQVYKQGVTKTAYHVAGEPTETYNVDNGDVHWLFEDNIVYDALCSTCYNVPASYSATLSKNGTYLLSIDGKYDMQNHSNPTEIGNSPIVIYKLTEDSMEWKFTVYGGDEGPVTYYQYLRHYPAQEQPRLTSLCDEWNVLEISNVTCGYCEEYRTYNFHLTTDTVIGGLLYSQLIKDGAYKGALREGNNRDIYCVPAGCSQEYLLYAFNAQVGDSLKNIWVGGYSSWIPDVRSAIVSEIKQTTPRTIELEVHYYEAPDAYEESIRNLTWIEGIGMPFGPMGAECSVFNGCADSKAKLLLCAYNNGEHIYTSDFGEQYGCEYNYDPFAPSDTIPLYIKDGPGSSTIEPVDPNEIIAKLILDELQMKEYLHTIIDYNLTKAPAANSSPAVKHVNPVVAADSFTDSETVTLTESGRYFLEMSHPDWDYTIVGTFVYNALQGLETIENSQSACTKELREGQLLIRQGEQLYTPTGIRIK